MAKFIIEVEDTEEGGMTMSFNADTLGNIGKDMKNNTCTQNLALLLLDTMEQVGLSIKDADIEKQT